MEIMNGPEIKELDEKTVAYVSFVGNYVGKTQVFKELFGKLCGWAGAKQLLGQGTVFLSSYPDDPNVTPPDKLRLEVCMVINDDVEVEGDVQKKKLPGGKYAVLRAELAGAEEYMQAWGKVIEWMEQNNHEIDMSRPSYEIYLNNPEEHPQKHHILDICMSIK